MDYLHLLENRFNQHKVVAYAKEHWHLSFHISVAYVVVIFSLRWIMSNRERFNLRVPLFMWSLTLALFSLMGTAVCVPQMLHLMFSSGWESTVCGDALTVGQPALWTFLFCFSKLPELVDTIFIVLRKQKLIFLHWYHHVTVFIYCWYHYAVQIRPAQWFITLNFLVHSIMYSYYALRASGRVRPPIWVNMFITMLQLLQMVFGVGINLFVYRKMSADPTWRCDGEVETSYFYVYWSFAMYFSYFLLFAHFFWSTYFNKSNKSSVSKSTTKGHLTNGSIHHNSISKANGHVPISNISPFPQCNGVTKRGFVPN